MNRFVFAAVAAVCFAGQSFGSVLWDNWGSASPYSAIVIKDTGGSSSDWGVGADDFVLGTDATVRSLTVSMFFGSTYDVTDWRIQIYNDAGGSPGSAIVDTAVAGGHYTGSGDRTLELMLPTAFDATAGVHYWIGVQAEYPTVQGNSIRWREATDLVRGDEAQYLISSAGIWGIDNSLGTGWWDIGLKNDTVADYVWKLNGDPVPEPFSLAGLAVALAALAARRRRNSRA